MEPLVESSRTMVFNLLIKVVMELLDLIGKGEYIMMS